MKINDDEVIFQTGTTQYANQGIIGISSDLEVTSGYDNGFSAVWDGDHSRPLNKEERMELAKYMITLWMRYALTDP